MNDDLRPVPVSGRTLASVRRALERWRRDPGRGRRIPAALWEAAAAVAQAQGVARSARALGLDYYALEQQVQRAPSRPRPGPRGAFVEVAWPPRVAAPACRLEVTNGRGVRLRVAVRGAVPPDVATLARVLWRAAR